MPFLFTGILYTTVMVLLFLAPRYPFSVVFAPIIKAFWGEHFLHYPFNLFLLPTLFNYAKNAVDFTFGLIMSGITVSMAAQLFQSTNPGWFLGLKKSVKRYFRLLCIWLVTFLFIYAFSKTLILALDRFTISVKAVILLMFFFGVVIQAVFACAIPAVIVENKKIFMSFKRAIALLKNYPVKLLFIVLGPNLILLPFLFINLRGIMEKSFPEATLFFLVFKIFCILAADLVYTVSITVFFMKNKAIEAGL